MPATNGNVLAHISINISKRFAVLIAADSQ